MCRYWLHGTVGPPSCSHLVRQDKTPKASPMEQSIIEYLPGLPQGTKPLRSCSGNWVKASPMKQSIIEYLPGLPQDNKPLRSCSWNWAKMLLKSYLKINDVIPKISRSSDSFSTVPKIVNSGWLGIHCAWVAYGTQVGFLSGICHSETPMTNNWSPLVIRVNYIAIAYRVRFWPLWWYWPILCGSSFS